MRFLRKLHLYLGCVFAPTLIFFAITGAWQTFGYHESMKDHSYTAPRALSFLSEIHKEAHVPPTPHRNPTPLRYFIFAAAVGLVTTTALGVLMAFRVSRKPLSATLCLIAGIALPTLLLWIYK